MTISEQIVLNAVNRANKTFQEIEKGLKEIGAAGQAAGAQAGGGLTNLEKAITGTRTTIGNLDKSVSVFGKNIGSASEAMHGLGVNIPTSALELFGQAVGGAVRFMKDAVSTASAFGEQVRSLKSVIGGTAEDASILIGVADDMGISYENLTTSLEAAIRAMSRPGAFKFDISAEGLAELSERFLEIPPGAERAALAMQMFGRSGAEMLKLLELGPEGIRDLAEDTKNFGVVIDDIDLNKLEELRKSLDAAADAKMRFDVEIGVAIASKKAALYNLFADFMNMQNYMDGHRMAESFLTDFGLIEGQGRSNAEALGQTTDATIAYTGATLDAAEAAEKFGNALETTTLGNYNHQILQVGTEMEGFARANEDFASKAQVAADEQAEYYRQVAEEIRQAQEEARQLAATISRELAGIEVPTLQLDVSISGGIAGVLDQLEFEALGGGRIQKVFEQVKAGIENNLIPDQLGKGFLESLFVGAQDIAVKSGDISKWDAMRNIKDELGVSWDEARTLLDNIETELPGRLQAIEGFMEGVSEAVKPETVDMQPLAENIGQGAEDIAGSAQAISESLGGIGDTFAPIITQSQDFALTWSSFSTTIDGLRDEFGQFFDDLRRAISGAITQVNNLQDAIDNLEGTSIDIEVNINYNTSGTPPPGGIGGGGPQRSGQLLAAQGADYIVPPGYPNDSYPVAAQSGERVIVIPRSQVSASHGAPRGEPMSAGGGVGAVYIGPFYVQIVANAGQSPGSIIGAMEQRMYEASRRAASALAAGSMYSGV